MKVKTDGSAAAEFVFAVPLLALLFAGLIQFSGLILNRQRALDVARFGASLQAAALAPSGRAAAEISLYAAQKFKDAAGVRITTGRFLETPASRFYRFVQTAVEVDGAQERVVEEEQPFND